MSNTSGPPAGTSMGAVSAAISLKGVTKSFGDVHAVNGIDLTIQPGEVVAFLGPNGAGKTTTLDMVLGLSEPTTGTVAIDGLTPRKAVDAGRVAAVTQTGGLLNDITVGEHVMLISKLFGYPPTRAAEVMDQAGITNIAKRKTQACSGGEKQRLKFAMALVSDPDLIILDEPTTGMDVGARKAFWADMHAQALTGRTVLFATHYLEEADEYADRIVMIVDGKVVADGTTADIRSRVSGRIVAAQFDSPEAASQAVAAVASFTRNGQVQGSQGSVRADDSDKVIRAWLQTTSAHDILVTSQGLEDAFLSLTQGDQK